MTFMSDATRICDPLLAPKPRITETHRVALARKQVELREAQSRLVGLQQELGELRAELAVLLRKARVISPTQMLLGDELRQALLEMIEVQQEEVREAEEELAQAQRALHAARGNEELELQRERQLHRHITRRRRTEPQHIDAATARCLPAAPAHHPD